MRIVRRILQNGGMLFGPYYKVDDSTRWGVYATSLESKSVTDVYIPKSKFKEMSVQELRIPVKDLEQLAKCKPFKYTHKLNEEWENASHKGCDICILKNYCINKIIILIKPSFKRMVLTNKELAVRVEYDRILIYE